MSLLRLAAFAAETGGGNPAGVHLSDALPLPVRMQAIAADVGYSETAFAAPEGDGWRVRYYSPLAEVAFCGHATIALGAALGQRFGAGRFALNLTNGAISVTVDENVNGWQATLSSPPTHSALLQPGLAAQLMSLFNIAPQDLDPRLPALRAHGGVDHAVFTLRDRRQLAAMSYPFDPMRDLMTSAGLTTVSLLYIAAPLAFVARNAFAIGGVIEDPATGAAAAALGGALVDLRWPELAASGTFHIRQGEDMGAPSDLTVTVTGRAGDPVAVSGAVRAIG